MVKKLIIFIILCVLTLPLAIGAVDQSDRLKSFLSLYCRTYESKDINKFATFFTPDATENNRPFKELLPIYKRNFETIDSFNYRIELISYFQSIDTGNIRIEGKYFNLFLSKGKSNENIGNISMELVESGDSFKIKQLYYGDKIQKGITVIKNPSSLKYSRIALVIGNSNYISSPLRNPVNDATAISEILRECGFDVTTGLNMNQYEMKKAINLLGDKISESSVALFYFSGHGMQVNGVNYLIPIGAKIRHEDDVDIESIGINRVLGKMSSVKDTTNILILDACRDNPFSRGFRSKQNGLAYMNAPSGTIIAYSTSPASIASDGDGQYGIYTEELINHLLLPNIKIEDVFKRVRVKVAHKTKNKQIPWESSSLMGDFYFSIKKNIPPSTGFSLSYYSQKADEMDQIKKSWEKYLEEMKTSFIEVQKYQERNVSKELKIESIESFLRTFDKNNPYSQEDNRIREKARSQIVYWKNYTPKKTEAYTQYITIGTSKNDVIRIQGTPSSISKYDAIGEEVWFYGNSAITFSRGRVKEWSNSSNNLKVRLPAGSEVTGKTYFTIGTSKNDVIRIQGTPSSINKYDAIGEEVWFYGNSAITFSRGRVKEWSNSSNNLKVRLEY